MTARRATLSVMALFFAGVAAGCVAGWAAIARAQDPYSGLDVFARVLTRIESDYVEPIEQEKLLEGAMDGLTDELDEHSVWLNPDEYRALSSDTEGQYFGIGIEVRRDSAGVRVARVMPGSPALRAGLAANDKVIAINGESLAALDLSQVQKRFRGPRNTSITLSVTREGWDEPREIDVTRDEIDIPAVEPGRLGDVAYVRLVGFQKRAAGDLEEAVDKLRADGATAGLLLDLRDNPGGLLDEAVAVTDLFLDEGVIVSTKGRIEGEKVHEATKGGFPADMKVVVLINGHSASASEIVAAALQDTGRGTLVGTRTYGKGSVQSVYRQLDESALKLTVGRYYTPSGEPVAAHKGRDPDVKIGYALRASNKDKLLADLETVEIAEEDRGRLLRLAQGIEERTVKRRPEIRWDLSPQQRAAIDPQVKKALDVLAGL